MKTKALDFVSEDLPYPQQVRAIHDFRVAFSKEIKLPFEPGSKMYKDLWESAEYETANAVVYTEVERMESEAAYVKRTWEKFMAPLWKLIPQSKTHCPDFQLTLQTKAWDHIYKNNTKTNHTTREGIENFEQAIAQELGTTVEAISDLWSQAYAQHSPKLETYPYPHVIFDDIAKQVALEWEVQKLDQE